MALKRANIFVSGNVQMAGFRGFVKKLADSLEIKGYADNLDDLLEVMKSFDNKAEKRIPATSQP